VHVLAVRLQRLREGRRRLRAVLKQVKIVLASFSLSPNPIRRVTNAALSSINTEVR
jgi:hypothetical protein